MFCVVLNETKKDLYIVRHIIDTNGEEDMSIIKQEYYNTFHKLEKDEFFLCRNNKEVNEVLLQHKTGPLLPVYDNRMYKLRIYKKAGINKGNLDHEEIFDTKPEMDKRYSELFDANENSLNPTAWELKDECWVRLENY